MLFTIAAAFALVIWIYLAAGRGGFWRCAERDDADPPAPAAWPSVTVLIPARDEADGIGRCLDSLLTQDCPGSWSVILVDDGSSDGTADVAARTAAACRAVDRLTIIPGVALPSGWTGKLWALNQGIAAAALRDPTPTYLLLTDADIVYANGMLRWLVAHAMDRRSVLTSLMVRLRCVSFPERCLVPAFVFFFQMLYPFSWVNRPGGTAAAAGGCMLVHLDALDDAGGIAAIRDALIDDCALAGKLKTIGPIWLGLTERVDSIRAYPGWSDIGRMVSRSAYAQLDYSLLKLFGTVVGMLLTFVVPPVAALAGTGAARVCGLAAWVLMAALFWPILRFYRISPLAGFALPAIASAYLVFTIDSALNFLRGKGGLWKGRFQAARTK